ncbi:TMV resistance protein N [Morus notabilis]|uniref:TMV resistance protein N n=1 Tax=Morus notabilis TaxID=981085 RepID=W9S227_9ROSA|nr:disease resistance protein LAZ5 [Morus notabilis]EXB82818.1 TMV resistance protein N [Morus notabilis]
MKHAIPALAKNFAVSTYKVLRPQTQTKSMNICTRPCDVFINHRGIDTKRTVAGLLYYHLSRLGLRPFLDSKNMKPGDNLYNKIDTAIHSCKIGVAVFSPRYCESKFCLHELALLMETRKRVIPIFCDVKPSELRVTNLVNGSCSALELQRYEAALQEAKFTVGLTFDCANGDWSEFLQTASDAVLENLIEVEGEKVLDEIDNNQIYLPNDSKKL